MNNENLDIPAILKLAEDWSAGWNNGDAEALLALYADEPILLPHGRPAVAGKNNILSIYRALFESYAVKGGGKVEEVYISGDLGYFWSSYSISAVPKAGGEPAESRGKSLFIVRRQQDGCWKISRLMDNGDTEE